MLEMVILIITIITTVINKKILVECVGFCEAVSNDAASFF